MSIPAPSGSFPDVRPLIDTHTHLCDPSFDADLGEVLARARRAGVGAIVTVSESLDDARENLDLTAAEPDLVHAAAGLFPTRLDLAEAEELIGFIRANAGRWVAIGEVGLDRWKVRAESELELQREIFGRFVDLALELDLPLNVHSRSAGRQTIELLLDRDARKVQLHAFDGRAARAEPAVEAGFYFSVPPSIVRSKQKQKLVRRLPLSCLMLETDSPVLGPEPGERNEPANVAISVRAIAEIKGIGEDEVVEATTRNALALYGPRLGG